MKGEKDQLAEQPGPGIIPRCQTAIANRANDRFLPVGNGQHRGAESVVLRVDSGDRFRIFQLAAVLAAAVVPGGSRLHDR